MNSPDEIELALEAWEKNGDGSMIALCFAVQNACGPNLPPGGGIVEFALRHALSRERTRVAELGAENAALKAQRRTMWQRCNDGDVPPVQTLKETQ